MHSTAISLQSHNLLMSGVNNISSVFLDYFINFDENFYARAISALFMVYRK